MRAWREDTGRVRIRSANASRVKTQEVTTTIGSQWLVLSGTCAEADWKTTQLRMSLSHTDKPSMGIEQAIWSSELRKIRTRLQPHSEKLFGNSVARPSFQTFRRCRSNSQIRFRRVASKRRFLVCFRGLRW